MATSSGEPIEVPGSKALMRDSQGYQGSLGRVIQDSFKRMCLRQCPLRAMPGWKKRHMKTNETNMFSLNIMRLGLAVCLLSVPSHLRSTEAIGKRTPKGANQEQTPILNDLAGGFRSQGALNECNMFCKGSKDLEQIRGTWTSCAFFLRANCWVF